MSPNPLFELSRYGQSVWYDNITRSLLKNGDLARMIKQDHLKGITSNPSIFEKAIAQSHDYDEVFAQISQTSAQVNSAEIFLEIAIEDIRQAAMLFQETYEESGGQDGMVSLEVSPHLANDVAATVERAKQLFERLARKNVMIKVPATEAGVEAVKQLTAEGVNVNATLLFSVDRYIEVANAYIEGLKQRLDKGLPVDHIVSVASFFVSRVDAKIDKQLTELNTDEALAEKGKAAIANAKLAFMQFERIYSEEFTELKNAGAHPQRLLWASTGTKDPQYSDVLYIDNLIGPRTVTTIPPKTYEAFREHGTISDSLMEGWGEAQAVINRLNGLGIQLDEVTRVLLEEGVASFAKSYDNLLAAIEQKLQDVKKVS